MSRCVRDAVLREVPVAGRRVRVCVCVGRGGMRGRYCAATRGLTGALKARGGQRVRGGGQESAHGKLGGRVSLGNAIKEKLEVQQRSRRIFNFEDSPHNLNHLWALATFPYS